MRCKPTIGTGSGSVMDWQTEWMRSMRHGDYAGAWAIETQVLAGRDPAARDDPRLPYHLRWVWDGQSFDGRHVLVRCYHGLGDTLQFARYLPLLRARAASVTLECQPSLLDLLAAVPGVDRLVAFDVTTPAPPAECDLEIMELAFALRVPPEEVSPPPLRCSPAVLPAGTRGLCWTSGDWDGERSIPQDLFAPLAIEPCLTLVTDATALPVLNPGGCPFDMPATAALVAGCDHVITVDTMVAHLAGTLGRPTCLLLKHVADWRWMTDRRDSPWYPAVRIFRQAETGDWIPVLRDVLDSLAERGTSDRPQPPPGSDLTRAGRKP